MMPLLGFFVAFSSYIWNNWECEFTQTWAIVHAASFRSLHVISNAWMIMRCMQGFGGHLNKVLSWKYIVPLSRLCYNVFLYHLPVMWYIFLSRRTQRPFS